MQRLTQQLIALIKEKILRPGNEYYGKLSSQVILKGYVK